MTVSVIYNGDDRVNFQADGVAPKYNIGKGDVIQNIPQAVYDRDLKNDKRFVIVTEKKGFHNKMEPTTKGGN